MRVWSGPRESDWRCVSMCEICGKNPHDSRCPNAPAPEYPTCPRCGAAPEMFFVDSKTGEKVACERCVSPREWYQLERGKDR